MPTLWAPKSFMPRETTKFKKSFQSKISINGIKNPEEFQSQIVSGDETYIYIYM